MTRYTVVWANDVLSDFVDNWIASESVMRGRLTALAGAIDRQLAVDPDQLGSPLPAKPVYRVLDISAQFRARVAFKVLPADRVVRVIRISVFPDS